MALTLQPPSCGTQVLTAPAGLRGVTGGVPRWTVNPTHPMHREEKTAYQYRSRRNKSFGKDERKNHW
eukprot:4609819-Amphidinium_carterae.2